MWISLLLVWDVFMWIIVTTHMLYTSNKIHLLLKLLRYRWSFGQSTRQWQ